MNSMDMQDVIRQGLSRYSEWRKSFLSMWNLPAEIDGLKISWALMPPARKELLKKYFPAEYAEITSKLEANSRK